MGLRQNAIARMDSGVTAPHLMFFDSFDKLLLECVDRERLPRLLYSHFPFLRSCHLLVLNRLLQPTSGNLHIILDILAVPRCQAFAELG